MKWIKQLLSRRLYNDLSAEIREHLKGKIEDLVAAGMLREDATRTARRAFGTVTLLEERSREVWQWPSIENFFMDVRFGLRMLRRTPGFTAVAIFTLALGIGANTAVFTLIGALMLRSLPVEKRGSSISSAKTIPVALTPELFPPARLICFPTASTRSSANGTPLSLKAWPHFRGRKWSSVWPGSAPATCPGAWKALW